MQRRRAGAGAVMISAMRFEDRTNLRDPTLPMVSSQRLTCAGAAPTQSFAH